MMAGLAIVSNRRRCSALVQLVGTMITKRFLWGERFAEPNPKRTNAATTSQFETSDLVTISLPKNK